MFRFNPESHDAWAEAIRRHQRQGDGEPLALMIRSGKPMPPEARECLAALAASTAKRARGAQPRTLDAARIYRDRRIQADYLRRQARSVEGESQDSIVLDLVADLEGTPDELQRTAVGDLVRRIAPYPEAEAE